MALATQCPHCHTTFRVAHDQLKLRAGLVRCGACKQIFNGIEQLLPPTEEKWTADAISSRSTTRNTEATLQPGNASVIRPSVNLTSSGNAPSVSSTSLHNPSENGRVTLGTAIPSNPAESSMERVHNEDPLLRMTLMDVAHHAPNRSEHIKPPLESTAQTDLLKQVIDELQSKPLRGEKKDVAQSEDELDKIEAAEYEEPSFVKQGRRKERFGRALHIVMLIGTLILFICLLFQGAYILRNQLAARFPNLKPVLTQVCARLSCQVMLPAHIDAISIESTELQTLATNKNTFTLAALLHNHDTLPQAWPNIELTLNDENGKPIARRVFMPREYLATDQDPQKGLAAETEHPIKLSFELAQLQASGYRVYLFYP